MPNKCAVVGCRVGYANGPRKSSFHFPKSISLQEKWIDFLTEQITHSLPSPVFVLCILKTSI